MIVLSIFCVGVALSISRKVDGVEEFSSLPNNSIVNANDFGSASGGIHCGSALDSNVDIGGWTHPNGRAVGVLADEGQVYVLFGVGRVALHRRGEFPASLEGIYTCTIPDEERVMQTLYVGIYTDANYRGAGEPLY